MLLIVGLGNPGIEYEKTRHNIGWWVLDLLRTKLTGLNLRLLCYSRVYELKHVLKKEVDFIVYPLTYMNNSGKAVKCLYEPRMDLVVIHDDLDLTVGKTRVRFGGSSAGHKGVSSIIDALGTDSFWRVKVGIGRPFSKQEVINYVLGEPQKNEKEVLIRAADYIADQLCLLITDRNFSRFQQNINSFNSNENN
ncbi:MAG TPA: aminoacyl-tRNA hydrolase [Coprothermobacter proteolyticus]|nr:aminoacyl-tRNA hydrolase [Coprothermobacter proteolyticus]HOL52745.1 aminoacyl-tRNA hydrolase [Coprothermobacter proteolyticus]